jgi:hypothetical protein
MEALNYNLENFISQTWYQFLERLPSFFFVLLLFCLGCLVAIWSGRLITRILKKLHLDDIFQNNSWRKGLEQSGIKINLSRATGLVVCWLMILFFLSLASEALGLVGASAFLMSVVAWLPNLLLAILIFIMATILADAAGNITRVSINWIDSSYAFVAEKFARWSIWGLAILIILRQVGIASEMIVILFQGLIYFLVLTFGLALGLGGKDIARDFLQRLKGRIKKEK